MCALSRELEALQASQVSTPEVVVGKGGATPTTEHSSITTEHESGRGHYKTWTVDYGLDCGLGFSH